MNVIKPPVHILIGLREVNYRSTIAYLQLYLPFRQCDDIMSREKQEWEENTLRPSTDRFKERSDRFTTDSGLEIEPVYSPEDISQGQEEYLDKLGFPGQYPYTRGVQPNMYRGRIWTMRQYSGYSTAYDTNQRFNYLLSQGQTGLSVAFDLPTQIGYDSDHPFSEGEVGKVGVPISSLEDMEILLNSIPLDQVSTSMTINSTASVLLCLYIAAAKRQGVSQEKLSGTLQNDILKEYIARGTYAYPPHPSMKLVVDIFKYCSENIPKWNSISISGYHMREAGATAIQELAFTFANAIAYVDAAIKAGLKVDDFAPRISFFFVSQNNLLEEVAKFRAARRMWAKIMKERFHAKDPRSIALRFHTQTAGVTLTAQQPDNNLVRSTIQGLAAVLGGTQSLHVNSKDEALGLPTEESAQLSLRTQQIIAYESGVADVVDPLGGSYYIENLTDRLEQSAFLEINKIDDLGGAISAIEQGYQMREIGESAYRHQTEVDQEDRIVVGVNRYVSEVPPIPNLLRVNTQAVQDQISRLQALRRKRNNPKVEESLERLRNIASSDVNSIPVILDCVENYCTLGEICQIFREEYGEQSEIVSF